MDMITNEAMFTRCQFQLSFVREILGFRFIGKFNSKFFFFPLEQFLRVPSIRQAVFSNLCYALQIISQWENDCQCKFPNFFQHSVDKMLIAYI